MKKLLLLFIGFCVSGAYVPQTWAQVEPAFYSYPYNHLDWYTVSSEHFLIHFQEGNSRSAQVVSRVAEEIYGPITELYNHEPERKVSIVLKDREDYSNGAAYFFDNKIDIWIPALDTPLRGTYDWFRNVITHEFTHIVQIQASMKKSRTYPAFYLQWLNYEDIRRPDVLFGYPNGIVTLPFANVSVPAWLAEGTAQFQRKDFLFDTWDSHRDMIFRTRVLSGTALSLEEMGTFSSKTSLERETIYNQGFAFSIYLAHRFGEQSLAKITDELSKKGVNDVAKAMERALGINGNQLYEEWIRDMKDVYQTSTQEIQPTSFTSVEDEGFFNFHPYYHPKTGELAYLSNKGRDYSRVSLYFVKDGAPSKQADLNMEVAQQSGHTHTFSCGHSVHQAKPLISSGNFDLSDDGRKVLFSRITLNKQGEEYSDVFVYDRETEKEKRLSWSARLSSPQWIDNEQHVLALTRRDGTMNIVIYDPEDRSMRSVTDYSDGEQLYHPVLNSDQTHVYVSYSGLRDREIHAYHLETGEKKVVLSNDTWDMRDVSISKDGRFLYYSSNRDDIFNIYQYELSSGEIKQITNVTGGAFMPEDDGKGTLWYADYQADGYKLVSTRIDPFEPQSKGSYNKQFSKEMIASQESELYVINNFDDTDITSLSDQQYSVADTGQVSVFLPTKRGISDRTITKYDTEYTGLSVFTALRFDNYTLPNGSNRKLLGAARFGDFAENIWRDAKIGAYFASREVVDRLNIFGGAFIGMGSRPTDGVGDFIAPGRLAGLDRDLFLIMEYIGLPFLKTHWSPTISVELYNLKRNVANGVNFEEFPCTACLPDTTFADLTFDIWEADIFLRSKLNRFSVLELGYLYSPYQVTTEPFFSREFGSVVEGATSRFFIGRSFSAAYYTRLDEYHNDGDVAPHGLRGMFRYIYQPAELLETYELTDGTLNPIYARSFNHSLELKTRFGFKALNQHWQIDARGFTFLNDQTSFFFLDYIGGFPGMRSYPFFALGAPTTAFARGSWIVPIWRNINRQYGRYTLDKLFMRFFAEAGNGWGGPLKTGDNIKTGIGAELRFSFNTNYLFPSKFFVSGSYGFNEYELTLPPEFITPGATNQVTYGREVLIHFGLLFDFEF